MKAIYLLIVEGEAGSGKGFSAWFPGLPGYYPLASTIRELKVVAERGAAHWLEDLAAEGSPLPRPIPRSKRQIELLLSSFGPDTDPLEAVPLTISFTPRSPGGHKKAARKVPGLKRL